jgi:PAS domain S-box-containing protein
MTGESSLQAVRRLRAWVGCVVALGVLAVASALFDPRLGDRPAAWKLALTGAAFLVGDIPALKFRFGHDHHSFTWSETAVVVTLALATGPWMVLVAPAFVCAGHVLSRRAPLKTAFNTAAFAVGTLLAMRVYELVATDASPHMWNDWVALGLAAAAFFVWNGVSVSVAVALSQNLPVFAVYRKGLGLNSVVFLGNTLFGITLVALVSVEPLMLLVLPFFCGLLLLAYQAYLRAIEERDTWELLQRTSRELLGITWAELAPLVVERAASLFRAELVEIMLVDRETGGHASVWRGTAAEVTGAAHVDLSASSTFWPRLISEREPFEIRYEQAPAVQRAELDEAGLKQWVVAPLLAHEQCLGALRIGFRGPVRMKPRELQVFSTFVNQVSSSVSNVRLFEEMNEERSKLSQIFSNSSDGIFSVDESGCIIGWNPAMEAITGREADEVVGRPLDRALDAVAEDGTPVNTCWLRQHIAGGEVQALAKVERRASEPRWLSISAAAVAGPDGDSFVVVARDVTAVWHAEQAKQDFVATVSHELRTPLTPLKGFLLTLMRPDFDPAPDERSQFYGRMLEQAHRLEHLIEDLLSISRIERGSFSVESGPVLVDEVIERVAAVSQRPIEVTLGGPDAVAHADAGRLEQVLANLVRNAEKYSPSEGRILVSVAHRPGEIEITVTDEGPGIAKEDHEVIFERFRQLGPHLTRSSGGAGLGLYIAKRLVEAMGGRIWVESELGHGARFRVALRSEITSTGNTSLVLN